MHLFCVVLSTVEASENEEPEQTADAEINPSTIDTEATITTENEGIIEPINPEKVPSQEEILTKGRHILKLYQYVYTLPKLLSYTNLIV